MKTRGEEDELDFLQGVNNEYIEGFLRLKNISVASKVKKDMIEKIPAEYEARKIEFIQEMIGFINSNKLNNERTKIKYNICPNHST
jgi:hypothetical protein